MKRMLSFVIAAVSLPLLVLVASAATATRSVTPTGRADAPEACGPKFSLIPSDNIGLGENRLKGVAANDSLVVAVGFYTKPNGRKSGLIEIWDGVKMRARTSDLGGYESEFVGIAANPNGGFKVVGIVWTRANKGLMSRIVVGSFNGRQFSKEADIRIPGSVRNIPHRILVTDSVTWVSGYFTRVFEDNIPTYPPDEDPPLPVMPPFVKGNSPTYPLLVRIEGTAWKQFPFEGEGWLYGIAGKSPTDVVVVGLIDVGYAAYRFKEEQWERIKRIDDFHHRRGEILALLGVAITDKGLMLSGYGRIFPGSAVGYAGDSTGGVVFELTDQDKVIRTVLAGGIGISYPQLKVLIPALPGHQGVRFYGVGRTLIPRPLDGTNGNYRLPIYNPAIWYPGYHDRDYPFKFRGEDMATVPERGEVWVAGAYDSGRTIVMRACPPLQESAGSG